MPVKLKVLMHVLCTYVSLCYCAQVHTYVCMYTYGVYHSLTGMIHMYVIRSYTLLGCAAAGVKY